ncbi:putative B3 domain-containing protein Os04g0347400 [Panicum virgatum]|uniref:putative B3 domain-containing protein Os04g0347400 n=1 Tax=Panicum virgatum TaxID=38727 RepID=UPI0019D5901C|nr:putative B3 domain-containing protein Os04g0347400 [Panicum virgatum]
MAHLFHALQRIPDELADEIGAGEALVVGPCGVKSRAVWPVGLGRDGGGAFLGRGWPEFAAAHGVGAGWRLALRHRGRGVLTVKAFDDSCCIRGLGVQQSAAAVQPSKRSEDTDRKLQFVCMLSPDSMEKMFVQYYISKGELNNPMAVVFGPLGKVNSIKLEMDESDVFFAGGWAQFLAFHCITASNTLVLRYEDNMVFTVKVFEPDGCQRKPKHKDNIMEQNEQEINLEERQEALSVPIWKCKSENDLPCSEVHKPKGFMPSLNEASLLGNSFYEIGQPSWIKKQINTNTLENDLALPIAFCDAIGLHKPSTITLKTTMTGSWQTLPLTFCNAIGLWEACTITLKTSLSSTRSWQVHVLPYKHATNLGTGWKRFCWDNEIKEGDTCTFNIVETTLWHVVIVHR